VPPLVEGQSTPVQLTAVQQDTAAMRARDVERWTSWALVGWAVLFGVIVLAVLLRAWHRRAPA
jgi:hypothetical protein